ncbi:hypothetical protein PsalN5692_00104 [Piscirickettsia salmonis]|uniref:hypothetical protein n=2 Tax=Piscirickettsia salmonis TaxID=1238 RepID=UPI0012B78545|nr:hypothetical protein [Piscirickettsia salmonis]QGP48701.1 hypothetical protein PsalN5692_00104 [Piscirickettsia salmonis]QGP52733.1 hypothetical protein PsalSR1_00121 [Piscirickettsia salmonis]QGP57596.1 hypothetical protein PsalBI1_00131 [Piscirickettsia salmonis]QGP62301.1 hypothetical protein PsalMR5_00121 [Piscirickettsia salmonis]
MKMRPGLGTLQVAMIALMVFNLMLPKAGIYMGKVPLTIGYLIIPIALLILFPFVCMQRRLVIDRRKLVIFFLLCSFFLFTVTSLTFSQTSIQNIFIWAASSFIVPLSTLVLLSYLIRLNENIFEKILIYSFYFVCLFGIIQFILLNTVHLNIQIPYLTVTGADPGIIFDKDNNRGFIVKFMSSYSNGNIFGIAVLMWFPLVAFSLIGSRKSIWLYRLCVFLSFSRTAWFMMFIVETLLMIKRKKGIYLVIFFFIMFIILLIVFSYGFGDFVFNYQLGGRLDQITSLSFSDIFSFGNDFALREMVYPGMLKTFGIFGLLLFVVVYLYPVISTWSQVLTDRAWFARIGIISYIFAMFIDGAYILMPIQFIYWLMVAALFHYSKKPELVK